MSRRVSGTASRLAKIRELAGCLRRLTPDEIPIAIVFLTGETHQGKLGLAYAELHYGASDTPAPQPSLTLKEVDAAFAELATSGKGASAVRAERLAALFSRATTDERDFLARLIVGELRQGALKGLMLEAVSAAAEIPVAEVRRAAMSAGGIAEVARAALAEGVRGLARFSIRLMQPVLPMLAQSADSVNEALERLGTAAFEWKLDGARAAPRNALILDGEAIALKPDGSPRSFQVTMRRFGRKLEVEAMRRELPLSVFFFDCLLRDDEALADRPPEERIHALKVSLPATAIIPRIVTADGAEAARFFDDALRHGHEGVMAKALTGPYEAGRRGAGWLKIKRANTLDLVVLAAEWGSGRRKGWLSNLHLGARDPTDGGYVMLGKTFKGLTDEMLKWQTEAFLKREARRDGHIVYLKPEIVVEVAFNEVQKSSQYLGGWPCALRA